MLEILYPAFYLILIHLFQFLIFISCMLSYQRLCRLPQLGEIRLVQNEIRELGIGGAGQNGLRLGHSRRHNGRQLAEPLLVIELLQPGGHDAPRVAEQVAHILRHGLALEDGLDVVIIIFHPEDVDEPPVRDHVLQFRKDPVSALRQSGVDLACPHLGQVGIAAVGQDLRRVLKGGGVQHALGPAVVQHPGLAAPEHGGNAEIIFFFISQVLPS